MIRFPRALRLPLATGLVLGALGACQHFDPGAYPVPETLYQASLRLFRTGHYAKAQEGFRKLTYDLSASDTLNILSRFFLAETYFGQGDYLTAAREFRRVTDENPTFRLAARALLRAGDAYGAMWTNTQLDPTNGRIALATYQEVQARFPGTAAAGMASVRIVALNEKLARKEMDNALFYYERGAYDSAILYFKDLIATYPSVTLVPDAYAYLIRSYKAIGWADEQAAFCGQLQQYYGQYLAHRADIQALCGDRVARR